MARRAEVYRDLFGDACMHRAAHLADWPALRALVRQLGAHGLMKCLVLDPDLPGPGWSAPQTVLLHIVLHCRRRTEKMRTVRGIQCVLPHTRADWWTHRATYHKAPLELLITYGNVQAVQVLLHAHPCLAQQTCGSDRESMMRLTFDLCWIGHDFDHHFRILKVLMDHGADPYHLDSLGRSVVTMLTELRVWEEGGTRVIWTRARQQRLLDVLDIDVPV